MKKILAMLLVVMMLFSLTGCGLSAAQQILDELLPESGTDVPPSGTEDTESDGTPGAEDLLTAEIALKPLPLYCAPREGGEYNDDGLSLSYRWEEIALRETAELPLPELRDALQKLSAERKAQALQNAEDLAATAQADAENGGYAPAYVYEDDMTVRRADSLLISLLFCSRYNAGGAHPVRWYEGITVDARTGAVLTIQDVFADTDILAQAIWDEVEALFPDGGLYEGMNAEKLGRMVEENSLPWVLDPAGLTVVFSEYMIAPYAAGASCVTIPYSWYPEQFDVRCTQLPEAYAVELDPLSDVPVFFDVVPEDGYVDSVSAWNVMQDEWYSEQVTVGINGSEAVLYDGISGAQSAYLLRMKNGMSAVYLFVSDGPGTDLHIGLLDADGICSQTLVPDADLPYLYMQEDGLYLELLTDPENFRLSFFVEMLSSMQGIRVYKTQPDASPYTAQQDYLLENDFELTLLRPMTFALSEGGEKEFAAGTQLTFLATDGSTWVDMCTGTGEEVRIYVDKSDWPDRVNGVDVFECFDGMMYAG